MYPYFNTEPFREPVPWKEIGLVDYPTVIKHPMDFGTIKKKLKKRQYNTLYAVNEDVRLIWSNCMTYNADGSDFYKLAEALKKKWETGYNKLLTDIGTAGSGSKDGSTAKTSLQDKRNMAKMLYIISKEDLGKILVDVENKCPAAIKRNSTEDELELNVDAISAPCMQDIMTFLQTCV